MTKNIFHLFYYLNNYLLMRTLQKRGGEYQVPEIEIVDVKVEAGFAVSTETGESASGGWGMTDNSGDGEWE